MNAPKCLLVLLLCLSLVSTLPTTTGADSVVIDHFNGGLANATLDFDNSVVNSSLAIDIPPGAVLTEASMVVEGVGVNGSPSSTLDFGNGVLGKNVLAYWNQGLKLYPPTVDPDNHRWTKIGNQEVLQIADVDDSTWLTQSGGQGLPPYEYPLQLYRFIPPSAGATSINVSWLGYAVNPLNLTISCWADMWLYDHSDLKWVRVANYTSASTVEVWLNYSISLPSDYISSNGTIDVIIAGPHTESNLAIAPGEILTDYIAVSVVSVGEIQYPRDVTLIIDGIEVLNIPGNVTVPRMIDDAYGLKAGLQTVLDEYPVTPVNATLVFEFTIPVPTPGLLVVRDLTIRYLPVVNEAPTFIGTPSVHIDEDAGRTAVMDLDVAFDDDYNMGELDFEVLMVDESPYPGAILAGVSEVSGGNTSLFITPDLDFYGGPVNVTLSATDSFGASLTVNISVIVDPVGDRPVLESGGTMEAFENSPFHYTFMVTDVDLPDDSFTFSDTSDYFDVDPATGEVNWTPSSNQIGEHRFGITVTDSFGLKDTQTYTVNVKNSNDPPIITSDLTIEATQGEETVYNIKAQDPDVPYGDVVSFFAFADGVQIDVDQATGRMVFTPGNAQVPSFEITLRVQDTLGTTDEQIMVVTVANVNDPPVFESPSEITVDQDVPWTYTLLVSDPDLDVDLAEDETLTFSGSGPDWLMPDEDGVIQFTAGQDEVGTHTATYTVKDRAGLQDVLTVEWTIRDVNDAPVITTVLPDDIPEDEEYNVTMAATDADGDTLTWSDDTNLFDIDPSTGTFVFTPTQAQVGDHLITITVEDGRGATTMVTWDFQVTNVNDAPVITSAEPSGKKTYDEGQKISFSAQATDEDGDTLTFTWKEGNKVLGTGRDLDVKDLSPGEHKVTLVVTDGNGGEATQDLTVEVSSTGFLASTLLMVVAVLVVVIVLGVVLYMRTASSGQTAPVTAAPKDEEEVVDKVTFEMAGVLEYDTAGVAVRKEGGSSDSVEEPIYSLEEAEQFHVPDEGDAELPEEQVEERPEE